MQRLLKMGMFGMVKSDLVMNITGECALATCRIGEDWQPKQQPLPLVRLCRCSPSSTAHLHCWKLVVFCPLLISLYGTARLAVLACVPFPQQCWPHSAGD